MDKSPDHIEIRIDPELHVLVVLESLKPRILAEFGPRIERLIGARSGGLDLYQEVALKIFRVLGTCRAETVSELEGWIMTVASTTANRMLTSNLKIESRSQKRESFRIDRTDWAAELNDEELAKVEVREEAALVVKQMATINPRYREAVSLYYLGGMNYKQICERMKCSNEAARLLVSRGLASLRKQILAKATKATTQKTAP